MRPDKISVSIVVATVTEKPPGIDCYFRVPTWAVYMRARSVCLHRGVLY